MPAEGEPAAQDAKAQRQRNENALARDIVDECRVQLMLKFRFLDLALWRMDLEPARVGAAYALATDAQRVAVDPPRAIARFGESFDELVRDYLHLILHCIFRHPFDSQHPNREAWGLTCDLVAESVAMDLCAGRFESEDDPARREALSEASLLAGSLVPSKLYALLEGAVSAPEGQRFRGIDRGKLNAWHDLFERDDHGAWPANAAHDRSSDAGDDDGACDEGDEPEGAEGIRASDASCAPDEAGGGASGEDASPDGAALDEGEDRFAPEDAPASGGDAAEEESDPGERDPDSDERASERAWEDVSRQIEMNLSTFSKEWGEEAGSFAANLALANRPVCSYRDFLRRFASVSEEMQINHDEFDYVYYTYGLELYGNLPLVEPLEYQETDRIREFVIAIDTSESVSGSLVRRFLEHTFSVLRESESYTSSVNIHVIQCDARVQTDLKISDIRDVDRVMERFTVRGFGGTDFRPVFDYVDTLRKQGEFTDLKGLIYFTDGLGTFPEKTPDYDAAFVFVDEDGRELPPVPPWAIKLVVNEEDINRSAGA